MPKLSAAPRRAKNMSAWLVREVWIWVPLERTTSIASIVSSARPVHLLISMYVGKVRTGCILLTPLSRRIPKAAVRVVSTKSYAGKGAVRERSVALCEDCETEVSEADAGADFCDVGCFGVGQCDVSRTNMKLTFIQSDFVELLQVDDQATVLPTERVTAV